MAQEYKFTLSQRVGFVESDEIGEIIGRAEYSASENAYYVRYRAGDGCQREGWIGESGLKEIEYIRQTTCNFEDVA